MRTVFFGEWWAAQNWIAQLFWLTLAVSSLLLAILLVLSLHEPAKDNDPAPAGRLSRILHARAILSFFTAFGGLGLLLYYRGATLELMLAVALAGGLILAALSEAAALLFSRFSGRQEPLNPDRLLAITGRVLEPIPPHRNGFGKVHLDGSDTPYEIEAITAGSELPPGSEIRVVGVIDGRILLVEPLENNGYPHEQQPNLRL